MSPTVGTPTPRDSVSLQVTPNIRTKSRAAPKFTKSRMRPNPAPPYGHCWDFCGSGCKWGAKCRYEHDDAVKKALDEKRAATTLPKPHHIYTQAASKPSAENGSLETSLVVTSKLRKTNVTQPSRQYLISPATPNGAKQTYTKNTNTFELTPPSTPSLGSIESPWETQTVVTWNASLSSKHTETGLWDAKGNYTPIDDITTRVFQKIYAASVKLPRLTTESRRSEKKNIQSLSEIADAALKCAQKQVPSPNSATSQPISTDEKSVTVKAAECYKKILSAGKIANVLNKVEQAHLDIIIASQYWNCHLPTTTNPHTTESSQVSKSAANPPQQCLTTQRCNNITKTNSQYLAWAKSNLRDATAIRLARTYCDSLQNGTVPMGLFKTMGKQAPPGTSFKYFPLLPYELREQIWLLALGSERNEVRLIWHHAEKDGHFTHNSFVNANSQQRLLFVNHELRNLALKHNYKLAFGTHYSPAETYFDFARDRLFIHSRSPSELPQFVRCIRSRDAQRVQSLAVPLRDFVQGNARRTAEALCRFKHVKKLYLVCGDGIEDVMYCGAGDAKLAKSIQRFFYSVWRKHNDPHSWPRIRMYTLPALLANNFKIDNMLY